MEPTTPTFCPHCNSENLHTTPKPPHVGLYCGDCGRWIKWLAQNNSISVMPFGKHKGKPFKEIPIDYIDWVLKNVELKDNLRKALELELIHKG